MIVATGSMPDGKAFQRAMPEHDALPGIERGNVASAEDVMARIARPGKRVIVLDETANWKGAGTALTLAEAGHEVTVVTSAPAVMAEMARTNADIQLRSRLRELGVVMLTETILREWHGDGATVQTFGGKPRAHRRGHAGHRHHQRVRNEAWATPCKPPRSATPWRPATPPWRSTRAASWRWPI